MPHRIAVLVFPDFQLLDAAGPLAAFEVASRYRDGHYALSVVAAQPPGTQTRSACGTSARR